MARPEGYRASITGKLEILAAIKLTVEKAIGKFDGHRSMSTQDLVDKRGISVKVWQNFVEAKRKIDRKTFEDLCKWLGLDWEKVVDEGQILIESDEPFYGRTKELADLEVWVKNPNCRMVTVHGFDGMGKSSLVRKLRERVSRHFQRAEWVPFSYDEPVENTLKYLLQQIDPQNLSVNLSPQQIRMQFRDRLKQQRCLIVLEQLPNKQTGRYEDYTDWLHELLEYHGGYHSSCILLITSYERHDGLTDVANNVEAVKRLHLEGVDNETGLDILRDREPNLLVDLESAAELVKLFEGYPSALRYVSTHIQETHEGNVRKFLKDPSIPKKTEKIIRKLIDNLERPALIILDILKDYAEPIPQSQLREVYLEQISDVRDFTTAINILLRRSLLVRYEGDTDYGKAFFYGLGGVTKQVILDYNINI
jgi:hypothetical protein